MNLCLIDLQVPESNMQEDMQWRSESVSDMCETTALAEGTLSDLWYHDESTWSCCRREARAGEIQEDGCVLLRAARRCREEPDAVYMKTNWVRVNKGTAEKPQVKCRLVAQELALGERLDELFAGTPSVSPVRLLLLHSRENGRCTMTVDVKTAFLYGVMRCVH